MASWATARWRWGRAGGQGSFHDNRGENFPIADTAGASVQNEIPAVSNMFTVMDEISGEEFSKYLNSFIICMARCLL
jgi:hypothetical protein